MRRLGINIARNPALFRIDMPSVITDLFYFILFIYLIFFFGLIGAVIV
jgi:hypothetical protein